MKKTLKYIFSFLAIAIIAFVLVSIFKLADLRTPEIKNNSQSEEQIKHAKSLLDNAIKKQGLDKINQFGTYEIIAKDNWKGMMGKMATPWDSNNDELRMTFTVGDFDSQVEILEGPNKGFVAGIQSWDYYEKENEEINSGIEDDNGKIFTLAAYHYFFEFANRLSNAPFIRYAGEDEFKGKAMDKIFVSWGNELTKKYDHYLVWIGKESGLIEASAFSTRDNPKPAPAFMYGSIRFDDFKNIGGILIPFKQTAMIGDPKDDINDFIHQLSISDFKWDASPTSKIRPLKKTAPMGDEKPNL